ncbi:C2H2 zinc finger protein [Ectocarpus siliculosus]|uniref:C2H2 zinc finger protein n=1 Tax=Ectocarpus siliculosus TaxID=2880 RepID=D8LDB0_ECTSI|nr:C2H2 zinc finger protein [Ectocarpus siliculosus]|eukprot:CBN80168.1 C2H2 zinc finger protein [Ectocarpus siliculosus]
MGTKIQGVGVSLGPVAFYFRQRHGKLDWKKLARIDVDEVVREVDIAVLQDLLDEVAFCEVSAEDIPPTGVDDLSVKLIRLSQLTIEYLLHVQECQEGYIQGLVRQLETANNNNQRLKAYAELSAKDGRRMKRESVQHKHVLNTCQSVLRQYGIDPRAIWESLPAEVAGAGGCSGPGAQPKDPRSCLPAAGMPSCGSHKPSAPPPPVEDSGVAQGGHNCGAAVSGGGASTSGTPVARVCGACGKAFSSEQFLRKHMDRRHPDLVRQDTAPLAEKEEVKNDSPASTPLPPPGEEARATEEQPSPPQQQEEAAGGKGTGSEDKGGGENVIGSEVVEGARRLGELVREREHARFKLEVVALRREVQDLKESRSRRPGGCQRKGGTRGRITAVPWQGGARVEAYLWGRDWGTFSSRPAAATG